MKFSDETRDKVQTRARNRCEKCGGYALYAQIHHRRPRGMGGSKDPAAGSPANALWLHPNCHEQVEKNRAAALANGWLVRQGHDPATVAVKRWNGWVMLDRDGAMRILPGNPTVIFTERSGQ